MWFTQQVSVKKTAHASTGLSTNGFLHVQLIFLGLCKKATWKVAYNDFRAQNSSDGKPGNTCVPIESEGVLGSLEAVDLMRSECADSIRARGQLCPLLPRTIF